MSSTTIAPEERTEFAFKFAAQCTSMLLQYLDGGRSKNIWGHKKHLRYGCRFSEVFLTLSNG